MQIRQTLSILLLAYVSTWLAGCGYHLVGRGTNQNFTIPKVLLAESLSDETPLLRALNDLNYQLVDSKANYRYKIVDASCDSFSIENTGEQQTLDLKCVISVGESIPESRELARRQVVTVGNSNDRIRDDDTLEAKTNLYTDILRQLH